MRVISKYLSVLCACAFLYPATASADPIIDYENFSAFPRIEFSTSVTSFYNGSLCDQNSANSMGTIQTSCGAIPGTTASATANQAGYALTVAAASNGIPGSTGYFNTNYTTADARTSVQDAGILHVPGGGDAQVQLFDNVMNSSTGAGSQNGLFQVEAEWGPVVNFTPSTQTIEITNIVNQTWEWGPGCQASTTTYPGDYINTECLPPNSNQGVNIPINVADGEALIISLAAAAGSTGDGSIEVSDPFTVVLPTGVTYSDSILPVSYSTPASAPVVPEPSPIVLMGTGMLGLLGLIYKRLSPNSQLDANPHPPCQ